MNRRSLVAASLFGLVCASDAKDHPADCATTLGARSSVLSGVDASSYLRDADTTVHRMASRGLPTDAKLHCALLFAQSAHEWSKGELVSSREKLYHAFSSILIKPDNRVELKEKAMDMQRTCERRAEELKKQKERWQLALEFFELVSGGRASERTRKRRWLNRVDADFMSLLFVACSRFACLICIRASIPSATSPCCTISVICTCVCPVCTTPSAPSPRH